MKTFLLKPRMYGLDSCHWKASTYHGPLIVSAPDECRARMIATLACGIAVEVTHRAQPVSCCPWGELVGLVDCTELLEPELLRDKEEIIDPPELDREWKDYSK